MKKISSCFKVLAFALALVLMLSATFTGVSAAETATITMESTTIYEGENPTFNYTGSNSKDWIAIYPSSDTAATDYWDYLYCSSDTVAFPSGQASRMAKGTWPLPAGSYEARLFSNDSYNVITTLSFTVAVDPTAKRFEVDGVEPNEDGTYTIEITNGLKLNTFNWGNNDWLRIFKVPHTGYTDNIQYDGYSNKKPGATNSFSWSYDNLKSWDLGKYECIAFDEDKGGWSRIDTIVIELVDNSVKKSITVDGVEPNEDGTYTIDKADGLKFNTENWGAKDWFRIYDGKCTSYGSNIKYDGYNNKLPGATNSFSLSADTLSGWTAGTYELIAFDEDIGGWARIGGFTFELIETPVEVDPNAKSLTLDKETYKVGDTIVASAANWVQGDFMRIYDVTNGGVTSYNNYVSGTNTYNNWAKDTYTFSTAAWTPGKYRLIAFDQGDMSGDAVFIADITFTVEASTEPEVVKTVSVKDVTPDADGNYTININDSLTIATGNWGAKDWMRIYYYDGTPNVPSNNTLDVVLYNGYGNYKPGAANSFVWSSVISLGMESGKTYEVIAFDEDIAGWTEIDRFLITVEGEIEVDPNAKTATLDKEEYMVGDIITVTTANWTVADNDYFRIYDVTNGAVSSYQNHKTVYNSYNDFGKTTYTINTAGWNPGKYRFLAFKNAAWNDHIADITFNVVENPDAKDVALDKESYIVGETINVTTTNFVGEGETGDFIVVWKTPVTSYNQTRYADTSSNRGQASYSFDTTGWPSGQYSLQAFTGDAGWNKIKEISFYVYSEEEAEQYTKWAKVDKTEYYQNEIITVKTNLWVAADHDFIRIYNVTTGGVTNYNGKYPDDPHGWVAQTYGTWGSSQYQFYPSDWEPGQYRIVAFDCGDFAKPFLLDVTITILEAAPEDEYYYEDGFVIFNKDATLNLSDIKVPIVEGQLFTGWNNIDDEVMENGSYSFVEGDAIIPTFIDYNANGAKDFDYAGVQVKTGSTAALRFIFEKSFAFTEALGTITDYGVIVLPSDILNGAGWAELVLGGKYTYNGTEYTAAQLSAINTLETTANGIRFSACITGITADRFTRQYTARGYFKYTDTNGIERIVYTDSISANAYEAAKEDLKADKLFGIQQLRLESIINAVEAVEKDATVIDFKTASTASDKLLVREVVIDSGKGGEAVTIMQLSDLHYNYINDLDRKEANPTVLSTYDNRTWGKDGAFAIASRPIIDYARTADQVMVTGDVLDYLSHGTVELMYKELWDKIPNAMIALGNHEYVQKMQGTANETLTLEERYNWVQNVWKHNIYYSSKVVNNKVMVIQMHNGERKFYDSQIAPLTADIETARANGYTVLLFMHETLATNNPAETAVNALHVNDAGWAYNEDFCNNSAGHHIGGNSEMDTATAAVYNLITNNADVIKGVFNGHIHSTFYTEISAKTASGEAAVIPQYTMTGSIYDAGHATKITVR